VINTMAQLKDWVIMCQLPSHSTQQLMEIHEKALRMCNHPDLKARLGAFYVLWAFLGMPDDGIIWYDVYLECRGDAV
jgi:hypothetical protein